MDGPLDVIFPLPSTLYQYNYRCSIPIMSASITDLQLVMIKAFFSLFIYFRFLASFFKHRRKNNAFLNYLEISL